MCLVPARVRMPEGRRFVFIFLFGPPGLEPHSLSTLSDKHLRSTDIRGGAESGAVVALEAWILSCPVPLSREQIQTIRGMIDV